MSPRLTLVVSLFALSATNAPVHAEFTPNVLPELEVSRTQGPITIDGDLDDPGWAWAARTEYWQETWPSYNVEPEIGLEGWMTYDDENLYFAIVVRENPEAIRASMRDRDDIWGDDYVGLIFDTYGNGAWAYELFINPFGIQGDLRWTQNGEDGGFDLVWSSEGRITEDGWQVEVAVPFKSLRFPDREFQEWRATFWYNRSRESRLRYSWSASDRDDPCWPCSWGTIRGIDGVSAGGALEILPSITGLRVSNLENPSDPTSSFEERESDAQFGLGVRYGISSSMAAEATFNPDFSQVESDADQIDTNTTFALFFPERRPFFQEGSDLFRSWVNAIYTRSINDPQWAGKLTGRTLTSSVALMVAQDENSPLIIPSEERSMTIPSIGRSWSTIARARRTLYGDSYLGGLGTFRTLDAGGSNAVYGADTLLRFRGNYQIEAQLLLSHTEELDAPELTPNRFTVDGSIDGELRTFSAGGDLYTDRLDGESFNGHAGYLSLERSSRYWGFDIDYWRTSQGFRADNGFITQNDNQRASVVTFGSVQVDNDWLDEIRPFFMAARVWNIDGVRKDEWIRPELNATFKGQTDIEVGYLWSNERFRGREISGIARWNVELDSRFSEFVSGGVEYESGDFVARSASTPRLGDGQRFEAGLNIKSPWKALFLDRFAIEPSFEWVRLEDPATGTIETPGFFEGYVTRTRVNFQATRRFFARVVFQFNNFNDALVVEPLLTYRVNPFSLLFAGSAMRWIDFGPTDVGGGNIRDFGFEQTDRLWFLKMQVFFRS